MPVTSSVRFAGTVTHVEPPSYLGDSRPKRLADRQSLRRSSSRETLRSSSRIPTQYIYSPSRARCIYGTNVLLLGPGREKHVLSHTAAVKAIAFCPWQRGLVATSGGSNDRTIRFWHVWSGACLATIAVYAQVTSLIWSISRREIAATFGYSQPDHPYRIAVFSWPDCRQIVKIPWPRSDFRALCAVAFPGGPNDRRGLRNGEAEGGLWSNRTREEGCIVVASSDGGIKFHEVWSDSKKRRTATVGPSHRGLYGNSRVLEGLEGSDIELDMESEAYIR